MLLGLVISTPGRRRHPSAARRNFALALSGLVSLVNLISLSLLAHFLLHGGRAGGRPLILAGVVLWVTNVLLFGVWYWQLDRGGPVARLTEPDRRPDFVFQQMTTGDYVERGWRPSFIDYMYLSYTNATAFSPTDTMPMTALAKVLMAIQSLAALVTVALVLARAVSILGG